MSQDYIALEWVKGEIEETLQQAQQALEAYVENTQDRTRLKFCLSYLHQVHGTLQMVEFYGAALLAEEMEALAKELAGGNLANEGDVLDVLMQAILQLPSYLEHVKVGRRDLPVILLPILNELRAARGESLMSETALFAPNIDVPAALTDAELNKFNDPGFAPWLTKLRQMQQTALLHILRSEQESLAIEYLQKVFSRLYKTLGKTPQGLVWLPALAFSEYLNSQQQIPKSAKPLLKQLDNQLKLLQDNGIGILNKPVPDDLLKNLLYYIAKSPLENGAIAAVKKKFSLASALPSEVELQQEREALLGPDKGTVGSVVGALIEEITALKDQLDLLVRGDDDRIESVKNLLPSIKQVVDTMGMLSLGMPRQVLQDQQGNLLRLIEQGDISDAELMDAAGALLYVEATLSGMQSEGTLVETRPEDASVTNAQKAVLREARNVLEQVKDSIVEYIAKQWDVEELDGVPGWLRSIEGSINMIPLPRIAKILELSANFVEHQLIAEQFKAQWSVMDNFADILTSVEYYIERYSKSPLEADESLLQRAESALSQLPDQSLDAEAIELEEIEPVAVEADVVEIGEAVEAIDSLEIETSEDEEIEVESIEIESSEIDVAAEVETADETAAEESEVIEPLETVQEDNDAATDTEELILEVTDSAVEEDEDDLIDEEIIEIFLEEAEEVLETLQEFWPVYKSNHDDKEAESTVRRAFHTLKGSGRMVQAAVIGEFAWSIENMLNRVIDQTIQLDANGCELIDHVITCIPSLIDDFRQRRPAGIDTLPLIAYADALSQGEAVADFSALAQSAEVESASLEAENSLEAESVDTEELEAEELELSNLAIEADLDVALDESSENDSDGVDDLGELSVSEVIDDSLAVVDGAEENSLDETLIEIFSSEVATHLESVDEFIQESHQANFYNDLSDQLQRALHTLKGSAHMAGITPIARIASPLERLVKELRAYQIKNTPGLVDLLTEGVRLIQVGMGQLETDPMAPLPKEEAFLADIVEMENLLLAPITTENPDQSLPDPQLLSQFLTQGMDVLIDADTIVYEWSQNPSETQALVQLNSELKQVISGAERADLDEVSEIAAVLSELYENILVDSNRAAATDGLITVLLAAHESLLNMLDCLAAGQSLVADNEALSKVKSASLLLIENSSEVAEPEEVLLEEVLLEDTDSDIEVASSLDELEDISTTEEAAEAIEIDIIEPDEELEVLEEQPSEILAESNWSSEAETPIETRVSASADNASTDAEVDAELLEIFLEEAQEIMEAAGVALHRWQSEPTNLRTVAELQRELHTLKGGARMAEMTEVADLCHELESIYEGLHDGRVQVREGLIPLLSQYHDILDDMLEHIRDGKAANFDRQLIEKIHAVSKGADPLNIDQAVFEYSVTESRQQELSELDRKELTETTGDIDSSDSETVVADIVATDLDESDLEILGIFLEEAQELQDELDGVLQDWQLEPDNLRATEEVQRIMHTLKGGARMGGLTEVGDLAHDFEAWMVKAQQGQISVDEEFFSEVFQRQDALAACIEKISQAFAQPDTQVGNSLVAEDAAEELAETEVTIADAEAKDSNQDTNVVPFKRGEAATEVVETNPAVLPTAAENRQLTQLDQEAVNKPQQGRRGPQEMVKVSSELLDNLVNLAGETSISRGRLEQQVTDFSNSLEEMDSTLERLRDQLRRLDMETEAQVLFRQERVTPNYEDFDPLEMDRYSHMQQLSRSLVESASDLLDIRESLSNKTRDAETLLLQQSRVNTELQEGLMQTRMVPFQRLVPRLRRIVRQIGQELDKQVEFNVYNADGEMDRTILERLISPLEHMLRNAVDHGIEDKQARSQTNKPSQGAIELRVSREGGDVLVVLKDDGRGINIDAVRKKAIERGLMTEDSQLTDIEIMQFILHAGFSTAQQVTQISGRGVGMDVVNSEIKQMGGTLFIDSIPGQGTEFQVRLPFTVSVNRALMVRVGDDLYAVPLDSIQGIVRVPTHQLETLYQKPALERTFDYGGAEHRLEYLGSMLGTEAQPKLAGQRMPTPVLLIKGETPYALQVDTLLGSREIVVKTLGAQFSSVMGVSGGTILGDGSVVIILDLPAMIRNQSNLEYQHARALDEIEAERRHELEQQTKRILVVDDSVTVRKVTTRLLERNGFEVFTAKDGVDAIATLQDHIPDLMLLDIEMPRMDGFEVASIVRHDSRLKDIPIIMITSRTGDKHRNRAFSIGVNEYLGKPFQEEALLSNIDKLLAGDAEN